MKLQTRYSKNNWISAVHLPGEYNICADKESSSVHDNMEWKLNPGLFTRLGGRWGFLDINMDLFASRLNHQVDKYCSWKPDPGALAVNAMSECWSNWNFYTFPLFNMVGRVLQ